TTNNVVRAISDHTKASTTGEVLFVTHAALMQSVYWHHRRDWHLIIDEAPQVFYHADNRSRSPTKSCIRSNALCNVRLRFVSGCSSVPGRSCRSHCREPPASRTPITAAGHGRGTVRRHRRSSPTGSVSDA